MRQPQIWTFAAIATILAACSTPQDDAAKAQQRSFEAQEALAKQRLELVATYQACVVDSAGNQPKIDACESYLKAAEALE